MNIEDKIKRARIQIQQRNSFFAYLSLYLKFKESKDLPDYAGCGVDIRGNFYYKEEFIKKLSDEELQGVIIHEILHLSLLHLLRLGTRQQLKFNVCADIVVNQLILDNNFKLPKDSILPQNNEVKVWGQIIKDTNKKVAEEIYDELKESKQNKNGKGNQNGQGTDENNQEGRFDKHFVGDENGEVLTENEKKAIQKEWNNRTEEALTISKMKGDLPRGIERIVGRLKESKINWKSLLNQFIIKQIPYDFTWNKPNKKSISVGTYMPDVLKEKISIVIGIDVSGSIGQEELTDFLSEIIGIARAYQERINMRLITHECSVVNDYEIRNGSIEKIKALEINGGGGTSHKEIFDFIKENERECKCAIFLTDGYSDCDEIEFNEYPFNKIFVISKGGTDNQIKDKCKIISLGN